MKNDQNLIILRRRIEDVECELRRLDRDLDQLNNPANHDDDFFYFLMVSIFSGYAIAKDDCLNFITDDLHGKNVIASAVLFIIFSILNNSLRQKQITSIKNEISLKQPQLANLQRLVDRFENSLDVNTENSENSEDKLIAPRYRPSPFTFYQAHNSASQRNTPSALSTPTPSEHSYEHAFKPT